MFQVMSEIHTLKEKGSTGRALYKKAKAHFDSRVKAGLVITLTNFVVVIVAVDIDNFVIVDEKQRKK